MKKLQNNFTTPEQSKRLLELGVPADSADCFFASFEQGELSQPHMLYGLLYSKRVPCGYEKFYLPCWSVGRLIEIYMIAAGLQWIDLCLPDDFTESIVKMFVGTKDLDFSKLED